MLNEFKEIPICGIFFLGDYREEDVASGVCLNSHPPNTQTSIRKLCLNPLKGVTQGIV